MTIKMLENELDGKKIAYHSETQFLVQVGRYAKGAYSTKYSIVGSLGKAVFWFNGINIGNGYKKRLVMVGGKPREVLARQASFPEGRGCSYNW
jgi:hypothetical protein